MKPGTEPLLATYCAKGTKVWRSKRSRTPMAILSDLRETGEGLDLWKEFSVAVTEVKRRRFSPSQGIANLVPNRHDT